MSNKYQKRYGDLSDTILTAEEEKACIIKYKETKDQEALTKILNSNLRLIIKEAENYKAFGNLETDDLVQAGIVGLLDALNKFNCDQETKLISYASLFIKKAMINTFRMSNPGMCLSAYDFSNANKLRKEMQKKGRKLTDEEIADLFNISGEGSSKDTINITKALVSSTGHVITSDKYSEDKNNYILSKTKEDKNRLQYEDDVIDKIIEKENVMELYRLLKEDILTEKEKEVIYNYFGFNKLEEKTLAKIAEENGLTRARVCQIKSMAIDKLRGHLIPQKI